MMVHFLFADDIPELAIALVEVFDVQVAPADPELQTLCEQAAENIVQHGWPNADVRTAEIRALLRTGGFKPSGRNKPAQEYLLRTATQEHKLPTICNAVDALNAISLQSGIPISLASLDRIGTDLVIRYGKPGESYVFNTGGQELNLEGLLCLCIDQGEQSIPVGSPVKDSMTAKLTETDHHLLACFYASRKAISSHELHRWALQLGHLMVHHCEASRFDVSLFPTTDW